MQISGSWSPRCAESGQVRGGWGYGYLVAMAAALAAFPKHADA